MAFWFAIVPFIPLIADAALWAYDALTGDDGESGSSGSSNPPDDEAFLTMVRELKSAKTTREIAQYYHIPANVIDTLRKNIAELSSVAETADIRTQEASETRYLAKSAKDRQVVGSQRKHMQRTLDKAASDERKYKVKAKQTRDEIRGVEQDLAKLTDLSNKPVSEANDLDAMQLANSLGVPISKQDVATKQIVEPDKAAAAMADDLIKNRLTSMEV